MFTLENLLHIIRKLVAACKGLHPLFLSNQANILLILLWRRVDDFKHLIVQCLRISVTLSRVKLHSTDSGIINISQC